MSELSELKIQEFKTLLLNYQEVLLETVQSEKESSATVELDQSKVGRLSRMDALQGQAMTQETKLRHELSLRNIAAALVRIEAGDYGYCKICDENIAEARLRADPSVSNCIECASKLENK
jgi:DnaK suppressor protein